MSDKKLISQLKSLKQVKPETEWLESNRSVLRAQIYSGVNLSDNMSFWSKLNIAFLRFEPYVIAVAIIVFFAGSGTASYLASKDSKPGESLYLAKVLGERAQYAVTFDNQAKTKLNLEFARQRVDELTQVLNTQTTNDSQSQIKTLKDDFKKEIAAARAKLPARQNPTPVAVKSVAQVKPTAKTTSTLKTAGKEADASFKSAEAAKNADRIDISVPVVKPTYNTTSSPTDALDQAEKLFDNANYQEASKALDEADKLIDKK